MARSQETSNKKEVRNKKEKKRKEKEKKRLQRKAQTKSGNTLDDMIAYVDEYGKITSTPPEPDKKAKVNIEDIEISTPKRAEGLENTERKGIVTFFNESKGFGFIRDLDNQQSVFVHATNFIDPIQENNKVTFIVEMGAKGPVATKVKLDK